MAPAPRAPAGGGGGTAATGGPGAQAAAVCVGAGGGEREPPRKWGAGAGRPGTPASAGRSPLEGGSRGSEWRRRRRRRRPPPNRPLLLPPGQGPQDGNHQSAPPEKVGWVRKFCGKGIFREIWKNRYAVLRGDQLCISEKEVGARRLQLPTLSLRGPGWGWGGLCASASPDLAPHPTLLPKQVRRSHLGELPGKVTPRVARRPELEVESAPIEWFSSANKRLSGDGESPRCCESWAAVPPCPCPGLWLEWGCLSLLWLLKQTLCKQQHIRHPFLPRTPTPFLSEAGTYAGQSSSRRTAAGSHGDTRPAQGQ